MPLKLSHTPGEYTSTFLLALQTIINDMLDDAPFAIIVRYEVDGRGDTPPREMLATGGMATEISNTAKLVLDLGGAELRIDMEHIIEIELP